jgi:hypothetical protein
MGTISDCWQLKVNSKEKSYLYANSTTQVSTRNNENFSDLKFVPFATSVNGTGGAPWDANISENFQKKLKRF